MSQCQCHYGRSTSPYKDVITSFSLIAPLLWVDVYNLIDLLNIVGYSHADYVRLGMDLTQWILFAWCLTPEWTNKSLHHDHLLFCLSALRLRPF